MTVFHCDLDNTLIYSYKQDIGEDKVMVELYQGREISFMTKKSFDNVKKVAEKLLLVPTTTRTVEQYGRIDLGFGVPPYALVCNGGVLLENGVPNWVWYQKSLELVAPCQGELDLAMEKLSQDNFVDFEVRFIEKLFIFTKSAQPEATVFALEQVLNLDLVDVWSHGTKVYVVPKTLHKGVAVERFRQWIGADFVVAAGDSGFDVPMLDCADLAFAPHTLDGAGKNWCICGAEVLFSDVLLEKILENLDLPPFHLAENCV